MQKLVGESLNNQVFRETIQCESLMFLHVLQEETLTAFVLESLLKDDGILNSLGSRNSVFLLSKGQAV